MPRNDVLARARQRAGIDVVSGDADRAGLLALTHDMYPNVDIALPSYAAWQYDQNPAGPAVARLAKAKNTVVGQYTVIPMEFKIGPSFMRGSLSLNTMTHPAHRAKGIFMILAEEAYAACLANGIHFTLGFPNPNSYSGFVRHLDFTHIGDLPLWILPLDLQGMMRAPSTRPAWVNRSVGALGPLWNAIRAGRRRLTGKSSLTVEEVQTVDEAFDALSGQCAEDYACMVLRNGAYVRWRFLNHPTRRYQIWVVRAGRQLSGYLVTRMTEVSGMRCGMLVDLLVRRDSDGKAAAKALVQHASDILQKEGALLLGCLMPQKTPGATALASAGFWRCPRRFLPQPFPAIVRWHGPGQAPVEMFSLKNWYLTMGDYDAI